MNGDRYFNRKYEYFVKTKKFRTPEEQRRDWTQESIDAKIYGVRGQIVDRSDAHGVCYGVKIGDEVIWYDPEELELD